MVEEEQNTDNNTYLFWLMLIGIISLAMYTYFQTINWTNILKELLQLISKILLIMFIIIGILSFIYYLKTREKRWTKKIKRKEQIQQEKNHIGDFLEKNLASMKSEELKNLQEQQNQIRNYLSESKKENINSINKKSGEIQEQLQITIREEKINDLDNEKYNLQQEIKELQRKKEKLQQNKEIEKQHIKYDLELDENKVFLKKDSTQQQLEILNEEGYQQCNEYCVEQQQNVTVFVKKVLNHSQTHTFLVWSVKNLLESFDVENIEEHETKDADLTFKYKNKKYALEIETGSLLKKKQQKIDKVKQLNRKYKKRWMFIVSNKNLLSQYNKLGFATQRKQVAKKIEKLLQK